VGALVAADEVLVPVEAHIMALNGLAQLLHTVDMVRDRLNEALRLLGIVACRVDARTRHAQDVVEELRKRFPAEVFRTVVRENVRLAEAPSFGQPVTAYDPRSTGAEDYRALAEEVLGRWKKRGAGKAPPEAAAKRRGRG
jgi:chromosome partitioning protein